MLFASSVTSWSEILLGDEEIKPGIILTFELAAKDSILPAEFYLPEKDTDVHVEMLAFWSSSSPKGSVSGGFIPYLDVNATITNQKTGNSFDFQLTPHLNLSDNFHYAQNISLPGDINDLYKLIFKIGAPKAGVLGMHFDWVASFGSGLIAGEEFEFIDLNLKDISLSSRR